MNKVIRLERESREQSFIRVRHKLNLTVSEGPILLCLADIEDFCYDFSIKFLTTFFASVRLEDCGKSRNQKKISIEGRYS